jgi:magnesium transporter
VLLVDSFAPHRGWLPIDPDAISPGKRDIMWAEVDVDTLESHDGELLAEVFGIDGQTLQTALDPRHRPKLETLADRRFLVLHELNERNGRLQPSQIACFFADDEVIVVHSSATRTLEAARELREQLGKELDANQLVGCILKVLVDDYQMIADRMHGDIGALEDIALETVDAPIQRQLYLISQRISRLNYYVVPLEKVVTGFTRLDGGSVGLRNDELKDLLLDIVHQVRSMDTTARAVINLTQAQREIELNDINKKLAGWAAIFGAGAFIAGIYGMNFELVPRRETLSGFLVVLGLIALVSVGLYFFLRNRRWL